jgi:hypothetical protein
VPFPAVRCPRRRARGAQPAVPGFAKIFPSGLPRFRGKICGRPGASGARGRLRVPKRWRKLTWPGSGLPQIQVPPGSPGEGSQQGYSQRYRLICLVTPRLRDAQRSCARK